MTLKFSFITFALLTGVHGNSQLRGRQLGDIYNYNQAIPWYTKKGKDLDYQPQCTGSVCGLWGDPHISTCDELNGKQFGCQAAGTVTLMKNPLYNIEGNFIPIGEDAINGLKQKRVKEGENHVDIHNAGATVTNDIAIQITDGSTKRTIQLGFGNLNTPIIDETTGKPLYPMEKNCNVGKSYNKHMIATKTDVWLGKCRKECEKNKECEFFNWYADKKCELFTEEADLLDADPAYGRVLSGTTDCGSAPPGVTKENQPAMDDESDKNKLVVGGWRRCPLLLHVDKELQDISTVNAIDGYLFNEDGISVQMIDGNHPSKRSEVIQILHGLEDGSTTEIIIEINGSGPAELWPCSFEMNVCLPEAAKDKFKDSTVGLLGTPNGDKNDDKNDRDGNKFDFDGLLNEVRNRDEYKDATGSCTWDIAMLEYCHDTWCVKSADEAIMVASPGQDDDDILCQPVEPVCPDSYCIMSVDQLDKACEDYKGEGYTHEDFATCKLECCHDSDECEDAKIHLEVYSGSESEDDLTLISIDESQTEAPATCPEDVKVLKLLGVTEYPSNQNTVTIVSQDKDTVTVNLNQNWLKPDGGSDQFVDAIYYSWQSDVFDTKCLAVTNVRSGDGYVENLKIQCLETKPITHLQICVEDSLENGILQPEDDATIPKCCEQPLEEKDKPTVCYVLEINCETACDPVTTFEESPAGFE